MTRLLFDVYLADGTMLMENVLAEEVAEVLGVRKEAVVSSAKAGYSLKKKYEVLEVDRRLSKKTDTELLEEYDETANQVRKALRRIRHGKRTKV